MFGGILGSSGMKPGQDFSPTFRISNRSQPWSQNVKWLFLPVLGAVGFHSYLGFS